MLPSAKEYFSNLNIHEIHFNRLSKDVIHLDADDETDEEGADNAPSTGASLIEMAFSKSKADERKSWISGLKPGVYLDYNEAQSAGVNYSDFINKELALFSQYGKPSPLNSIASLTSLPRTPLSHPSLSFGDRRPAFASKHY